MNSNQRLRARIILGVIIVAAFILCCALYSTQILQGGTYSAKAQKQYTKPTNVLFDRGTIYFTDKDGTRTAAATVGSGNLVYMNPKMVTDPNGTYAALSQYLSSLDQTNFLSQIEASNTSYVELADKIPDTTAQNIKNLQLGGLYVTPETWRSYPGGTLAAHELGLVGEDASSSQIVGRYGLESYYNTVLERVGLGSTVNVFAEIFSGIQDSVFGGTSNSGQGDIVTSIEPTVEAYLQKTVQDTNDAWHPDQIGAIVMDPNTGQILAMTSLPTYDPNDTSDVSDISVFSNPLVQSDYEMGSIMKPLTMASALDSGAEQPDSEYDDVGCLVLDKKKICNFDGRARGVIPMQQILSQSLNVGAATIAMKEGSTTFESYFDTFGLEGKVGIDLPSESQPLTDALKRGTDIDVATASYGQGIAVTPVGMIRALSLLANGGYLVTPHVVDEIDYTDGTTKNIAPAKVGPVLKPQTVQEVDNMLSIVADVALGNGIYKMDHYTFAAKTGTAEIADHVNGGYYPDRYLHSFIGFFPAHNAKFIIFLYQVYPKGAEYASETLTKPYIDLMKFMINYYNIPPDR